jgi:hypothetical protein
VTSISSLSSGAARRLRQLPHQVASASMSSLTTDAGLAGRQVLPADRGRSSSSEKDTDRTRDAKEMSSSSSSSSSSRPRSSANSGCSET